MIRIDRQWQHRLAHLAVNFRDMESRLGRMCTHVSTGSSIHSREYCIGQVVVFLKGFVGHNSSVTVLKVLFSNIGNELWEVSQPVTLPARRPAQKGTCRQARAACRRQVRHTRCPLAGFVNCPARGNGNVLHRLSRPDVQSEMCVAAYWCCGASLASQTRRMPEALPNGHV